jgi:hypothetical protein
MGVFDKNIIINEEAFVKASADIEALSGDLTKLSNKIKNLLSTLDKGFETPCGAKFHNSCEANLLRPLNDQRLVLNHISQVLRTSKSKYQSVFDEYRKLNSSISSYHG